MPRNKKHRKIKQPPVFTSFKPPGIPKKFTESISLSLDEYEAVRLADFVSLTHKEAADKMEISRSTFTRLIEKARMKIADFIIHGKTLNIEGGNIHFKKNLIKCNDCNHFFNTEFTLVQTNCPKCNSDKLINFANKHGHGKCCKDFNNEL